MITETGVLLKHVFLDLTEVVLQVLHLVYSEFQLDVHTSSLCQKLAELIHHIAHSSGIFIYYFNFSLNSSQLC